MTDFLNYQYSEKTIEFLIGNDLMINATEMGTLFNKRPVDFLRLDATTALVEAMKKKQFNGFKCEDSTHLNSVKALFKPENTTQSEDGTLIYATIFGREHGGTWMHRWLAMDYAMWLDVDFKLWVLERIDYLFTNYAQAHRKIVIREQKLQKDRHILLLQNADNPIVKKLAAIDDELKEVRNEKSNETKKNYKNWASDAGMF